MKTNVSVDRPEAAIQAAALPRWAIALIAAIIFTACGWKAPVRAPDKPDIDGATAYRTVVELSGGQCAGRLIGSEGGAMARRCITGRLERAGLAVRILEFDDRVGMNDGMAFLELEAARGAEPIRFTYRDEFREVLRGGYEGGLAAGPLCLAGGGGEAFEPGSVLLVPAAAYDPDRLGGWAAAGAAGLLVELPAGSMQQRPLWAGQPPGTLVRIKVGMPVLALSGEAFGRLAAKASRRDGGAAPRVRFSSPVRFADVTGRSVLAEWNGDGRDFEPALVVMAHYDHVGTDPDGSFFPGAHDNASGVSLVLGIAEAAAADGLRADIAFILTDGEECGLSGARAFARSPAFPLAGVTVINVDMAGSRSDTAYDVYSSGGQASLELSRQVEAALRNAGLRAESRHPVYNVDHAPLAEAGAVAVTVCEYYTGTYHTHGDTAETIDPAELDAVGDALYALAIERLGR